MYTRVRWRSRITYSMNVSNGYFLLQYKGQPTLKCVVLVVWCHIWTRPLNPRRQVSNLSKNIHEICGQDEHSGSIPTVFVGIWSPTMSQHVGCSDGQAGTLGWSHRADSDNTSHLTYFPHTQPLNIDTLLGCKYRCDYTVLTLSVF